LYRKPANIPPAVREAPAFTPGRMSPKADPEDLGLSPDGERA